MSMIVRENIVPNRTIVDSDLTSDGDLTPDFLCLIQALYLSLQLQGKADAIFRRKQMVLLRDHVSSKVAKAHFFKGQEKSKV